MMHDHCRKFLMDIYDVEFSLNTADTLEFEKSYKNRRI